MTHFPYRNWCPHCVAAKALGERRGARTLEWQYKRHLVTIIGVDYFYLTSGGWKSRKEMMDMGYDEEKIRTARSQGEIAKCVIIRDLTTTKCTFAHVVPVKGTAEVEGRYVADMIAEDIVWLGHVKLIIKADNEPALQSLVVETLRRVRIIANDELEGVSKEQPEEYESQSNGGVEVGIRVLR